jgi:hypothetical protein
MPSMINFNEKQEIKSFHSEAINSISASQIDIQKADNVTLEIARVTICLTSNHNECNGKYIDSFIGKYFIKCLCNCHDKKSKKEDNRIDIVSDIVESIKMNNNIQQER